MHDSYSRVLSSNTFTTHTCTSTHTHTNTHTPTYIHGRMHTYRWTYTTTPTPRDSRTLKGGSDELIGGSMLAYKIPPSWRPKEVPLRARMYVIMYVFMYLCMHVVMYVFMYFCIELIRKHVCMPKYIQ